MQPPMEVMVLGDRYRADAVLGRGAHGEVFAGWDVRLERPVAIKILRAGVGEHPGYVRRFRREARISARLRSPHAVPIYDVGQTDDGRLYMVMERIEGLTVRAVLRGGPLPLVRALALVDQLCALLAEAHAAGLVHRDLKPDNLMIDTVEGHGDRLRVLDFGVAKVTESSGQTTQGLVGTAAYIAPEVWAEQPVDGRADLYATGLILYELLAGAPAVAARTMHGAARVHLFEGPVPLGERSPPVVVPAAVEALIGALAAREPGARIASADAARARIGAIRRSLAVGGADAAAPSGLPEPPLEPAAPADAAQSVGLASTAAGFDSLDAPLPAPDEGTAAGLDSLDAHDTPARGWSAPSGAPDGPAFASVDPTIAPEVATPADGDEPSPSPATLEARQPARRRATWAVALLGVAALGAAAWLGAGDASSGSGLVSPTRPPSSTGHVAPDHVAPDHVAPDHVAASAGAPAGAKSGAFEATDGRRSPPSAAGRLERAGASRSVVDAGAASARGARRAARSESRASRGARLVVDPPGARVWRDGRLLGTAPLDLAFDRPTVVVIDAPDHYGQRVEISPRRKPYRVKLEPVIRLD